MDEMVKHQIIRDDGFIEVEIYKIEDYDDYLFSQIQKDASCLPCIRDVHHKQKFYFDIHNCTCLLDYLHQHIFEEQEAFSFFIILFEAMIALNRTKYLSYQLSNIYLTKQQPTIRFLVFPLNKDPWEHEESQISDFLFMCMEHVQIQNGWNVLGILCIGWKQKQTSLTSVLHILYEEKKKLYKKTFLRLFQKKEEPFEIRGLPNRVRYPSSTFAQQVEVEEEDEQFKTVILFSQECYFECVETKTQVMVTEAMFCIGRHSKNHLCIQDPQISLYHAQFEKETSVLKDLDSSNGTFVNHKRIQECVLQHLDTVRFAGKEYIYYEK